MKKTLLLVFVHGFKGSDNTFGRFPQDLAQLLSHALPKINVLSVQYPQFETRGDLRGCVAKFKEWLQNKVIDIEVENRTPSPTVEPSVHVVLCGHSMGGIVAAEALLSIATDEPVAAAVQQSGWANDTTNSTTGREDVGRESRPVSLEVQAEGEKEEEKRSSSAPLPESTRLFFPYIQALLAFDTPYLGISPGVLAHGAEEHLNHASAAYKAFDTASNLFGWNSPRSASPQPIANASQRALPAADGSTASGYGKWGKYAMYGGAAAAIAGAAGAAYLSRNQINEGFAWAGSHLEFIGCLARGPELQKRVESVVKLGKDQAIGFGNFYGALDEKVSSKTQYAGAVVGQDRTFCVVPSSSREADSPTGSKRHAPAPSSPRPPPKRRKTKEEAELAQEMEEGEKVHRYAEDTSRSKGDWVKCINSVATDELKAHTSMFAPQKNPDYHAMVPRARDWIAGWVDRGWYEGAEGDEDVEIGEDAEGGGQEISP